MASTYIQIPVESGVGSVNDVGATSPITSTGGVNPVISLVNNGAYSQEYWIQFVDGSDSTGDGSFFAPWKTLEYAATQVSGNSLIHLTGFFPYDQSSGPITLPPNIALIADYPGAQINQDLVISPPAGNAQVTLVNITLFGSVSWVENTAGLNQLWLVNSEVDGGITFQQTGAGKSGSFLWLRNSTAVDITATCGQISLNTCLVIGNVDYADSGTSFFIVNSSDLAAAISLNGGVSAYFSGCLADGGYSITATATGSGTPSIFSDSASIPPTLSGTSTLQLTAQSQYVNYSPADSGVWDGDPATVKEAIDRIAAVVGAMTPIP